MTLKFGTWQQKIKQHPFRSAIIIGAGLLGITLIVVLVLGYWLQWDWVGLGPYTSPPHPNNTDFQRKKTLWDWLQLLIVPIMLAIGGFWLNQIQKSREQRTTEQQAKLERELTRDNQQESLLQSYFDSMSELLLEKKLRKSESDAEVRNIARVRTLTALSRLDADRKGSVVRFLYESGLIRKGKAIVDLSGADLTEMALFGNIFAARYEGVNLSEADLHGVSLTRAKLYSANLQGANLSGAYLKETDLGGADLSGADLSGAFFSNVDLNYANLSGATLINTFLLEANLSGAILEGLRLDSVNLFRANLKGAKGITREACDGRREAIGRHNYADGSKHF